jgi:hypothetical protein
MYIYVLNYFFLFILSLVFCLSPLSLSLCLCFLFPSIYFFLSLTSPFILLWLSPLFLLYLFIPIPLFVPSICSRSLPSVSPLVWYLWSSASPICIFPSVFSFSLSLFICLYSFACFLLSLSLPSVSISVSYAPLLLLCLPYITSPPKYGIPYTKKKNGIPRNSTGRSSAESKSLPYKILYSAECQKVAHPIPIPSVVNHKIPICHLFFTGKVANLVSSKIPR